MICGPDILCRGLPSVFGDFLSYALNLKNSAQFHDIDYHTHIQAFREFADLRFTVAERLE
jgi:hypothetical protein